MPPASSTTRTISSSWNARAPNGWRRWASASRQFELAHGVVFVVHRMEIEYRLPARLGDRLDATLELVELGRARMVALQEVRRGASVLAQARVTLACVDRAHWRPARIPAALRGRLEKLR